MEANRGEIWLVDLNPGDDQAPLNAGPALVVSDDMFNRSLAEMVIILPLTSVHKGIPTHVELKTDFLDGTGYVKCEDIRPVSTKRLVRRIGQVDGQVMKLVEERLKLLLGLA